MNDIIAQKATAASDAILDYCEGLLKPSRTRDDNIKAMSLQSVRILVKDLLASVKNSAEGQFLTGEWESYEYMHSQHENLAIADVGISLAKRIREMFDVDKMLSDIASARKSKVWSIERTPKQWLQILARLKKPMGDTKFRQMRNSGEFKVKPGGNTKRVSIRLVDLPDGYSDSM